MECVVGVQKNSTKCIESYASLILCCNRLDDHKMKSFCVNSRFRIIQIEGRFKNYVIYLLSQPRGARLLAFVRLRGLLPNLKAHHPSILYTKEKNRCTFSLNVSWYQTPISEAENSFRIQRDKASKAGTRCNSSLRCNISSTDAYNPIDGYKQQSTHTMPQALNST